MDKIAVYTGSKNLYSDMITSAKSVIAHSDVDKIYFLIEDDAFPYEIPDIIETKDITNNTVFDPWGPNQTSRFTKFALYRAALALEFPQYDRVLSLDCDTIAIRDISHVWELPIDDYYFAASIEPHRSICGLMYTNVGVNLMNLKKIRDDNKVQNYISVLNRQKFDFVDQDVMNYLSQGYIYEMHSEYNANNWTKPVQNPRIIHFAGMKQDSWHNHPAVKKYSNMSWDEVFSMQKMNKDYPS